MTTAAIRSATVRGKVTDSRVGPRTLLLITGLDNEVVDVVELLLPPGYSARPAVGVDVLLHQVLGSRDHLVAVGGDALGSGIADLEPGEFGFSQGTMRLVMRLDHVEITSPTVVMQGAADGSGMVNLTIKDMPTGPSGLPSGTVWDNGGSLARTP